MPRIFLSRELADNSIFDIQQFNNQLQSMDNTPNFKQPTIPKRTSIEKTSIKLPLKESSHRHNYKQNIQHTQQLFESRGSPINTGDQSTKTMFTARSQIRSSNQAQALSSRSKGAGNQSVRKRKKWLELKDVITHQKVQSLKQNFILKLRRNNPFSTPVVHNLEQGHTFSDFLDQHGFQPTELVQKLLSLMFVINIVGSIFLYTLALVFYEIRQSLAMQILQIFGTTIFFIQLVFNFVTVRFSLGRKLQTYRQIGFDYIHSKFPVDIANLTAVIIAAIVDGQLIISFISMIVLLKVSDCLQKLQKLQVYLIQNYYNQQYWSLVKVFLFNFCFAHFLAIILIAMAKINPDSNWMQTKGIVASSWYERYIWSYYWSTTIMLTIGFGDITPVCYEQACCMIFIETISCIVLAYNINCVGSLIANIRSQDLEKGKNQKIFKKLADKHRITEGLSWKINNYIQQHTNIKKLFNIEQQVQFVQSLPTAYRTDYLKQANKTVFKNLFFFNNLMEKTLFSLAQKIQMKITHPQQVVLSHQRNFDLLILKNGQIGYTSRKTNRTYNRFVFDTIAIKQNDQPFLLHTNFITKSRANYGIKSIVYSVIYFLQYDALIEILQESHLDYELYNQLRDKNKYKIDQFQVFPCQYCTTKHTKFGCTKLHFVPLAQHVINRQLFKQKQGRNKRISSFQRIQSQRQNCLTTFLFNQQIYAQKKQEQKELVQQTAKRIKKQNFVIEQLRAIDNDQHEEFAKQKTYRNMNQVQAMAKMQSKILENTTEVIKMYISKALGLEKGEDDVWLLDLDRMKNYKDYFNPDNPCNLEEKFDVEARLVIRAQKDVSRALTKVFLGANRQQDQSNKHSLSQFQSFTEKVETKANPNMVDGVKEQDISQLQSHSDNKHSESLHGYESNNQNQVSQNSGHAVSIDQIFQLEKLFNLNPKHH